MVYEITPIRLLPACVNIGDSTLNNEDTSLMESFCRSIVVMIFCLLSLIAFSWATSSIPFASSFFSEDNMCPFSFSSNSKFQTEKKGSFKTILYKLLVIVTSSDFTDTLWYYDNLQIANFRSAVFCIPFWT